MVVRGRYLALGHWVAGGLDPTEFPPDPSTPGTSCFRSGDMVLLRDDGTLVPIGRADRQVKINGSRIQPGDTEAALRGLPGVADAAVLVHGDADAPMLVGFVVSAPEQPAAQSEAQFSRGLRSVLSALLPPQQVPAQIRVVAAIPLLPSLKPDLAALRALLATEDAPGVLVRVWTRLRGAKRPALAARVRPAVPRDGPAP
jgi:acyl-coenzyme A synthetase/AMP-(fatty) acid ligase